MAASETVDEKEILQLSRREAYELIIELTSALAGGLLCGSIYSNVAPSIQIQDRGVNIKRILFAVEGGK